MPKLRAAVAEVVAAAWIATPSAWQNPATAAYEAASVKANRDSGMASLRRQPGRLTVVNCGVRESLEGIRLGGAPLSRFASTLSRQLGRLVVDRTGLSGQWDFQLTFARELRGPLPPGMEPPDPDGPSLFTAIQEQLGLKLEATKGPVDVVVVESVRRPTEN
jgi:hypothetical protein